MTHPIPATQLQARSRFTQEGVLELSLEPVPIPELSADDVLVRVDAAPLNPSDIGLLLGPADVTTARVHHEGGRTITVLSVPERALKGLTSRMGQSLAVGNEGAGLVVASGASAAAQALRGKLVAMLGGAMYSEYRAMKADQCLVLPADVTAVEGASCFVNPLTALGMVETMKREGHTALAHTAAASNLGRMLNRLCQRDGIRLVNIVRKPEQAALLRAEGAAYVCDTSAPSFIDDLTDALTATGATIAFDAVGGGPLAGQILACMEAAIGRAAKSFDRYGSATHKQVYVYGRLDTSPIELSGAFGMTWGAGGWLLFPFLQKIGAEGVQRLRSRVVAELKTTFASHYTATLSLREALEPEHIVAYRKRATSAKFLIAPHKR